MLAVSNSIMYVYDKMLKKVFHQDLPGQPKTCWVIRCLPTAAINRWIWYYLPESLSTWLFRGEKTNRTWKTPSLSEKQLFFLGTFEDVSPKPNRRTWGMAGSSTRVTWIFSLKNVMLEVRGTFKFVCLFVCLVVGWLVGWLFVCLFGCCLFGLFVCLFVCLIFLFFLLLWLWLFVVVRHGMWLISWLRPWVTDKSWLRCGWHRSSPHRGVDPCRHVGPYRDEKVQVKFGLFSFHRWPVDPWNQHISDLI